MASQNRHERQLMRQRGAGRNVGTTDFGLEFGNAFQAPARSSRSRSRTPALQPIHERRTSKTPLRRSREPSHPGSGRSTTRSGLPNSEGATASAPDVPDINQLRPTKRRRTTVYHQSLAAVEEPLEPEIEASVVHERDRMGRDAPVAASQSANNGKGPQKQDVNEEEKENLTPNNTRKTAKRRKRKSIGQQSARRKKRPSSETAAASNQVPMMADVNRGPQSPDLEHTPQFPGADDEGDMEDQDEADAVLFGTHAPSLNLPRPASAPAEAPGLPRKSRKKRKSITLLRKPKKISNAADTRRSLQTATKSPQLDEDEATPGQPQLRAQSGTARKRRSDLTAPSVGSSPIPSIERDRVSDDEDYEDEEHSPEPPTPAPQRKTTKARRSRGDAGTGSNAPERPGPRSSKPSFPIIAHRLVDFDALPTIDELGESELDTDEERAREAEKRATIDRPNPNAVDVLGQYCRETVESTIERLSMGAGSNRAERKRKKTALEAVGDELNDRLFEMSAAVENRIQLERRTRKAQRTKSELQARWVEIRKQREAIALKCDEVRQQNWQREKDREQKWTISEAAHKLELEAARTGPQEEDSLEYLLRAVADDVSDTSGSGGLLDRIKAFNGRLERVAGVLEGREV